MRKYGNTKVQIDGIVFDSKAESQRYQELLLLESAGKVEDLTVHPRYELQPAFRDRWGRRHRAIEYVGDFAYIEVINSHSAMGVSVVEDVKGVVTPVFAIKRRLFHFRYPDIDLRILEV